MARLDNVHRSTVLHTVPSLARRLAASRSLWLALLSLVSILWLISAVAGRVTRAGGRQPVMDMASLLVDRVLGIETARKVGNADLGFEPGTQGYYVATPWPALLHLWRVLRELDIHTQDVFIDYGSGKGRALLIAARFPFKRVIGVEMSPVLNRIAAANLRATRWLTRAEVELVPTNATAYVVPPDATVFYFYNPFKDDVFAAVVDRIFTSLDAVPRTITIIYTNPVMHDHLVARGLRMTQALGDTRVYANSGPSWDGG